MPRSACAPRSSATKRPATSRWVAALISTVSDSANVWMRAATFGVSPSASVSLRPAAPTSPTTTGPVWMPTRTEKRWFAGSASSRAISSTIARPARTARSASSSCASGQPKGTVAQVLRHVAPEARDHCACGALVGARGGAPVLRVEARRDLGGAHHVAEQHRELAALPRLRVTTLAPRPRGVFGEQRLSAGVAEARTGAERRAAGGAGARERRAAASAEARLGSVLVLAARTTHACPRSGLTCARVAQPTIESGLPSRLLPPRCRARSGCAAHH